MPALALERLGAPFHRNFPAADKPTAIFPSGDRGHIAAGQRGLCCGNRLVAEVRARLYDPVAKRESGEMSKQAMRDEAERLVREALEQKKLVVQQGKTRIDTKCRKCGAPNRVSAGQGQVRVPFACKECGEKQVTL
jgi:hypothetical protein